ncbi:MAG: PEP-CTERM system TPR-repeat protein PrsT, partial [Pseudomonadota bacterium]|nr:PEP-CTERM system TPR-repeat protein PrsT [Pseudomonadota bacterium]
MFFCLVTASGLIACGEEKPEALIKSAKSYIEKSDDRAAVIQLKSALQQNPRSAEARFLLGRTMLDIGDAVSAEIELRKALDLRYPDAAVLPVLARALLLAGKHQKIVESYSSSVLAEPIATADLKTSVATAYAAQGDREKAEVAVNSALSTVPGYAPALLLSARLKA